MPVSYYPVPDGYIVWRDNSGVYHVARKPANVILSASSRTQALTRLYTLLQQQDQKMTIWPPKEPA